MSFDFNFETNCVEKNRYDGTLLPLNSPHCRINTLKRNHTSDVAIGHADTSQFLSTIPTLRVPATEIERRKTQRGERLVASCLCLLARVAVRARAISVCVFLQSYPIFYLQRKLSTIF
jgi:hypothetical protein